MTVVSETEADYGTQMGLRRSMYQVYNFLEAIDAGYLDENTYHNATYVPVAKLSPVPVLNAITVLSRQACGKRRVGCPVVPAGRWSWEGIDNRAEVRNCSGGSGT